MKKFIAISIIIVVSNLSLFSQANNFKPLFSFGIKQGVNISSVNFTPGISQGLNLGYTGGLVYKYQNEKLFGLQLELNYTQKGWAEDLNTINNSYSRRLNYIELPLITQVILGKRPNFKYYINLGTSFAYLLSEKEDVEVNNEDYRRDYYEKKVENYFDYSVLGGLGLMYNTGVGEFQLGVRYQLAFTDLFKTGDDMIFENSQNQLFSFYLTYFFFDNK